MGENEGRIAQKHCEANNLSGEITFVSVRFAFVIVIVGLAVGSAAAFSIEGVTVGPRPLTQSNVPTMTVYVLTPTVRAGLYAPTQVSRTNQNVHVNIYPTSGMLQILDSMNVVAWLGTFEVGDYTYEVQLYPAWPVGWGTRYVQGTFLAQPSLQVSWSGTHLVGVTE